MHHLLFFVCLCVLPRIAVLGTGTLIILLEKRVCCGGPMSHGVQELGWGGGRRNHLCLCCGSRYFKLNNAVLGFNSGVSTADNSPLPPPEQQALH